MKSIDRSDYSVIRMFFNYAMPSSVAMLATSIYFVIEGVILGQGLGGRALAAINIAFPATIFFNALIFAISVGGATLMSIRMGEGKTDEANNLFTQCMIIMEALTVIFIVISLLFLRPISIFLGADSALLPDVMAYLKWLIISGITFVPCTGLNTFVRNDGNPRLILYGSLANTVTTAAFVYVTVYILKLGIACAGIGGGIGSAVSLIIVSTHVVNKRGVLSFGIPRIIISDIRKAIHLGVPSMMTEISMAFSMFFFNFILIKRIGELGISAYSIVVYINTFINLLVMGLAQGLQPIVSYNYGAGRIKTVTRTYRIAILSAAAISVLLIAVIMLFDSYIIRIFSGNNKKLLNMAKTALFFSCFSYIPIGINIVNISYFQSIERSRISTAISVLRGFVLVQLGLLILPAILDSTGIWLSPLFGESLTCLFTIFAADTRIKKILTACRSKISQKT